jgi:hypothetical protein
LIEKVFDTRSDCGVTAHCGIPVVAACWIEQDKPHDDL